jgi:uncharacterized protein (TIGR02266 family)
VTSTYRHVARDGCVLVTLSECQCGMGVAKRKNSRPRCRSSQSSRVTYMEDPMAAPVSTDARAHRRLALELEVSLQSDSNFYIGLTENLSNGGIFVATHLVQPIGTVVALTLRLPNRKEPLQLTGRVKWVREWSAALEAPPGMGIEFETIPDDSARAIHEFLAARTPLFFDMP